MIHVDNLLVYLSSIGSNTDIESKAVVDFVVDIESSEPEEPLILALRKRSRRSCSRIHYTRPSACIAVPAVQNDGKFAVVFFTAAINGTEGFSIAVQLCLSSASKIIPG